MTADLTTIVNALMGLAAAAVTAAIPIIVPYVIKHLGIANDAALTAKLDMAATAAAGEAYNFALAHEGGLKSVAVKNGALATGVAYLTANMPDTLKQLGITPDKVQLMVSARLGKLLATDPTVGAGQPAPAPAVAAPAVAPVAPVAPPVAAAPVAPPVAAPAAA